MKISWLASACRKFPMLLVMAGLSLPLAAKEMQLDYADQLKPLLKLGEARFDRLEGVFRLRQVKTEHICPGIQASLVNGDNRRALSIAADGRVDVPLESALAEAKASLVLSKPDDAPSCDLSITVQAKPLSGTLFHYLDLLELVDQMQTFFKESPGFFSIFSPTVKGLELHFADDTATLVVHAAAGDERLKATDGKLVLKRDKHWAEENPMVELSREPDAVQPWLD